MKQFAGFTLVELLVVMTIIALLLGVVTPRLAHQTDRAEETALKQDLSAMRSAIDMYKGDTDRYPASIKALVDEHYIRRIPVDPITGSADTWKIIEIDDAGEKHVFDVRSGAAGVGRDGTPYADW